MTGNLEDTKIAVDSLSICMMINGLELMIPIAFLTGTGVRVANELGAGNGKGARFAMIISVTQSLVIGIVFSVLVVFLHDQIGWIFSSSEAVINAVKNLSILLAFTILLNSVQPVLSGVAVGSGWQSFVAYINLGCYYFIGLPLGFVMGWIYKFGVKQSQQTSTRITCGGDKSTYLFDRDRRRSLGRRIDRSERVVRRARRESGEMSATRDRRVSIAFGIAVQIDIQERGESCEMNEFS
ncbi:hypothetical protein YC2023_021037 [Brassica napus]